GAQRRRRLDAAVRLRQLHRRATRVGPRGQTTAVLLQNTLYSVFALTDGSAKIGEGYLYDASCRPDVCDPGPSGVVTFGAGDVVAPGGASAVGNPFLFTGRRLDPELSRTDPQTGALTGLYYYRARYMDTEQGRFLQRDPVRLAEDVNA